MAPPQKFQLSQDIRDILFVDELFTNSTIGRVIISWVHLSPGIAQSVAEAKEHMQWFMDIDDNPHTTAHLQPIIAEFENIAAFAIAQGYLV